MGLITNLWLLMIHEFLLLFAAQERRWDEEAEGSLHVESQFTLHLHNRDVLMEKQVCLFPHLGSQTYERANNSQTALVDHLKINRQTCRCLIDWTCAIISSHVTFPSTDNCVCVSVHTCDSHWEQWLSQRGREDCLETLTGFITNTRD